MAYFCSELSISLPCKLEDCKLSISIGKYVLEIPFLWTKETFPVQQYQFIDTDILVYLENDTTKLIIRNDGSCREYTKDNYLIRSYRCKIKRIEEVLQYEAQGCFIYYINGSSYFSMCNIFKVTDEIRIVVPVQFCGLCFVLTRKPESIYFEDVLKGSLTFEYDAGENYLWRVNNITKQRSYSLRAFLVNPKKTAYVLGGNYGL